MMNPKKPARRWSRLLASIGATLALAVLPTAASAQSASVSAWTAANFRDWAYIPYWATQTQINNFATNGMYSHVSDVLYFGGYRPDSSGNITSASSSFTTQFNTIRSQMVTSGFDLHLSMFEVTGGQTDATWTSIINSPTNRANFVTQVTNLLKGTASATDDLKGFNFDWERPTSAALWGNYTQLARELRASINPLGMEVSVCDFGSTDSRWDDTSLFDAKVYDQLMMMTYNLSATSSASWANTKKTLTGQGTAKAFSDDQIAVGFGTYTEGASTVGLSSIIAANPNLPYDAGSYTGTIGSTTGTWTFESRKQAREKAQLAIDRGMPGVFSWTLHYDATNNMGLHRVIHHYAMLKKDVPDVNLDGKVDASDATLMVTNQGLATSNTGVATAAQIDSFYNNGNWEKGDHDGNGWVNQADADWLATRFTAIGVTLPDKLAYTGEFEGLSNSIGLNGRWRAGKNAQNTLNETSNFKQEANNFLTWNGTGIGASRKSNSFVTIRNQSAAEGAASLNGQTRTMRTSLSSNIDLGQNTEAYFSFLVRENTGTLTTTQLASGNRTLSIQFLSGFGFNQFELALRGLQGDLSLLSNVDTTGEDKTMTGFTSNATFLIVGKLAGNGANANTMSVSLFPTGSSVPDFTLPTFQWMLTAQGSAGYNPIINGIQISSLFEANYTLSNLWIGGASVIPEPASISLLAIGAIALTRKRRA